VLDVELHGREARRIRIAFRAALALAAATVVLALLVRYRPDLANRALVPLGLPPADGAAAVAAAGASAGTPVVESGALVALSGDSAMPTLTISSMAGTAHTEGLVTDVVLLPCTTVNPRPDGGYVIPPHNPNHRTIVALTSPPGGPRRGLVIPPHDETKRSWITLQLVPLDSVLANMLGIPAHDPDSATVARSAAMGCIEGEAPVIAQETREGR
jgi:hypothetical protein